MYVRAAATAASLRTNDRERRRGWWLALVALLFSLVFFHPVLSPLSPSPSHVAVRGPPGENSDDHALRCVFFLSFLPSSFPPPFLTPCFFPSFFFPLFFLLSAGIAAGVPVFVYRRNSMYILYARTPDQPLSCMACTFVRPDVRIVINTTLAFRTMRHASLCLAHVSSSRLCSSGAIDQVCLAECTPSYSPSFFPSLSTLSLSAPPCPPLFPSFFPTATCSSPIGSAARLAASRENRFVLCRCNDERGEKRLWFLAVFMGPRIRVLPFPLLLSRYATDQPRPRFRPIVRDGCYFRTRNVSSCFVTLGEATTTNDADVRTRWSALDNDLSRGEKQSAICFPFSKSSALFPRPDLIHGVGSVVREVIAQTSISSGI